MKKVFLWLWLLTKRQLKSVLFLLLIIAVPLVSLVVSRMEGFSEGAENVVALFARDDDAVPVATIEDLLELESSYEFVVLESPEAVEQAVLNEKAVCGYIFNENISQLIKAGKYRNHITVVKNKGDVLADMANEVVFASFFKEFTRQIVINYVSGNEKFAPVLDEALLQIEGAYDIYVDSDATFKVKFESLDVNGEFADTKVLESQVMNFPLRGVMAVLIFMGGLLGVVNWLMDYEKGVFRTLGYDFVNLSRGFYVVIPATLMGISSVVSLILTGQNRNVLYEIAIMILYIAIITLAGVLCSYVVKKSIVMVSALPVFVMGSLLICPVFVDLAMYLPAFGLVRYLFVPYYYMFFF